ncbi:MAG: hypothetical protein ABR559_05375 [Gemmatimonadota bacterium]
MARPLLVLLTAVGLLDWAARPAAAQTLELQAYGARTGVSLDDDLTQLLLGGHADLGRLAENVRLQPFVTVGLGDNALSFLLAGEVHYLFPVDAARTRLLPYAGAGLGFSHVNLDEEDADDSSEAVLLLAGGIDVPASTWWHYFAEARMAIADESVFRIEGGITWEY